MTKCEQPTNNVLPAGAGELAAQGGVAKLEEFRNASPQILPDARVAKPGEFRNSPGGIEGRNDLLESLPQPVLTSKGAGPRR
jgi:hypothetical protein